MARDDVLAGEKFVHEHFRENWKELSVTWKITYLAKHSPDIKIRTAMRELLQRSELVAKIHEIAPWYTDGDSRSESRLAAMLARKNGITWWRELLANDDTAALLGTIDDVWHAVKTEPLLAKTHEELPGTPAIPPEYRSKPIAKKVAAALLGRPNEDSGVKWLNFCITDGTISCERQGRQSFVFDIRQFPESVHPKLLPPKSR